MNQVQSVGRISWAVNTTLTRKNRPFRLTSRTNPSFLLLNRWRAQLLRLLYLSRLQATHQLLLDNSAVFGALAHCSGSFDLTRVCSGVDYCVGSEFACSSWKERN
jgi:hypothetical protein